MSNHDRSCLTVGVMTVLVATCAHLAPGVVRAQIPSPYLAFGPSVQANQLVDAYLDQPRVVWREQGDVTLVVWSRHSEGGVQGRLFVGKTPVGDEVQVSAAGAGNDRAVVGLDASGSFVVMWRSTADGTVRRRILDGSTLTWGPELVIPRPDARALGLGPDGGFAVTWRQSSLVLGQRYDAAGAPQGQAFEVGPLAFGPDHASETILVSSDNTTTVAWGQSYQDQTTGAVSSGVGVQRFDAAGVPVGSAVVAGGYLPIGGPGTVVGLGRTAGDGSGGFLVVHNELEVYDRDYFRVKVSRYRADCVPEFAGEIVFAGGYSYSERAGQGVTAGPGDGFLVLWSDQDVDLAVRRYPTGGPPGELPFTVSDRAVSYYGTEADIATSDASADFVTAWVDYCGASQCLWVRWFGYRPVIFEDDFEGGDPSAWSLVLP